MVATHDGIETLMVKWLVVSRPCAYVEAVGFQAGDDVLI